MKLEFFPAAEQELLEAAKEYEGYLSGLGSDFLLEVERLASVLVVLPSLGEKLDPIHRRIPLRSFPYALIFRRDEISFISSRWPIADAGRGTGSRACKIANKKCFEPTRPKQGRLKHGVGLRK
jgi:hypothetical protein